MQAGYTSPPDPQGFNAVVWEIVTQIPPGKVSTYGQIAAMIPPPAGMEAGRYASFSPRWVGGAMAACPPGIPWQRVINSQGKISLRPGGGSQQQRQLLEAEGVEFDERDRVNLRRFGWNGPAQEWLYAHGLQTPPALAGPEQPSLF
jgi:methylated-DNA-protein-cysteine methyltransferase related protein